MTGQQLNLKLNLGAISARYRETGDWYHPLEFFPGILFDINGYVLFQSEEDYNKCPQINFGQDINIPNGISSINGYINFDINQLFIVNLLKNDLENDKENDLENDLRVKREYSTFHRNQAHVQTVKNAFNNICAICETFIQINNEQYYSEVHHIVPLNENGLDQIDNMICVCPNCHVKLDFKILPIDLTQIYNPNNHIINQHYVDIHNNNIVLKQL